MARRLIVGPGPDGHLGPWPGMLVDSDTPGVILPGPAVHSFSAIARLCEFYQAVAHVTEIAQRQMREAGRWLAEEPGA